MTCPLLPRCTHLYGTGEEGWLVQGIPVDGDCVITHVLDVLGSSFMLHGPYMMPLAPRAATVFAMVGKMVKKSILKKVGGDANFVKTC